MSSISHRAKSFVRKRFKAMEAAKIATDTKIITTALYARAFFRRLCPSSPSSCILLPLSLTVLSACDGEPTVFRSVNVHIVAPYPFDFGKSLVFPECASSAFVIPLQLWASSRDFDMLISFWVLISAKGKGNLW